MSEGGDAMTTVRCTKAGRKCTDATCPHKREHEPARYAGARTCTDVAHAVLCNARKDGVPVRVCCAAMRTAKAKGEAE